MIFKLFRRFFSILICSCFFFQAFGQVQIVNTLAGKTSPLDGVGLNAHFILPYQIVVKGSIGYISDQGNNALRKINFVTKQVTTVLQNLDSLGGGLALSSTGDSLFFSTNRNRLKMYRISNQSLKTLDTLVEKDINAIVCTRKGELIISGGTGHRILLRNKLGQYSRLAGKLGLTGVTDGIDSVARFFNIAGFALSQTEDTVYISDCFNSKIRRLVRSTHLVSTLTVGGSIYGPRQIDLNKKKDTLYIANASGQTIIHHALKTNQSLLVAGGNLIKDYVDGAPASSRFNYPYGIARTDSGIIVLDQVNQRIRQISNGKVKTIAGIGLIGDGTGVETRFNAPYDVISHPKKDTIYVSDQFNHVIRMMDLKTNKVTTVAGSGFIGNKSGIGRLADLSRPTSMAISATGDSLYFVEPFNNHIKLLLTKTGEVKLLAGSDTAGYVDKPQGKFSRFNRPTDIALKGKFLYVADGQNHKIRTVNVSTTEVKTYAGTTAGFKDTIITAAKFNRPATLEWVDDRLFVGEDAGLRIRVINTTAGTVSIWAGNGSLGMTDGLGTAARFKGISKLSYNPVFGLLYVAGYANDGIMRTVGVDIPMVKTLVSSTGYENGLIKNAKFTGPMGVSVNSGRNRFIVADVNNNRLRVVNWYFNKAPHALMDTVLLLTEDQGLHVQNSFAKNLHNGNTTGDTLQKFSFTIATPSYPRLQFISLDSAGSLTVNSSPDSNGVFNVRILMKDNGGTEIGGVDTSVYFTKVKIQPVNDAPTFTIAGNNEALNTQPMVSSDFITASNAGPFDERSQALSYSIRVNKPGFFIQQPVIENNALKFTPNADSLGVVEASIICRDNGGVAFGGVDSSVTQTFQIFIVDHLQAKALKENKLAVYPNPASTELHFLNLPPDSRKLSWINTLGQLVAEEELSPGQTQVKIPATAKGMLLIKTEGPKPMTGRILVR